MIIRLRPSQIKRRMKVEHPLLDDAVSYSNEELAPFVQRRLDGADPGELIMALRSCLRFLVGCYLANWPVTRRWEEDMISEGLTAITRLVQELEPDERPILKRASQVIRGAIERYVNVQRGIALPSLAQQHRSEDLAGLAISCDEIPDIEDPSLNQEVVDIQDALENLNLRCELAKSFMDPETWKLTNKEIAAEHGVSESTVSRVRSELYEQYQEICNG